MIIVHPHLRTTAWHCSRPRQQYHCLPLLLHKAIISLFPYFSCTIRLYSLPYHNILFKIILLGHWIFSHGYTDLSRTVVFSFCQGPSVFHSSAWRILARSGGQVATEKLFRPWMENCNRVALILVRGPQPCYKFSIHSCWSYCIESAKFYKISYYSESVHISPS